MARRALAGAFDRAVLDRRLGDHAFSDAPSTKPPYGLRAADVLPQVPRVHAALALCHPRFDINLGVAIRSAEAAGFREVFVIGREAVFRSPARGTERVIDLHYAADAAALIRTARARDYQLVAIQQTPDGVAYHRAEYPPRPLFVVGAEDMGMPAALRLGADLVVEIPQFGVIDSLNVAAAATTVMMYWRASRETSSSVGGEGH
jgi:tRNA G18 (ribose-2'-O)-methylase SpoU